jgi:hypothetical protein
MPDTKTVNYKLIYSPRENFDGNAEVNGWRKLGYRILSISTHGKTPAEKGLIIILKGPVRFEHLRALNNLDVKIEFIE